MSRLVTRHREIRLPGEGLVWFDTIADAVEVEAHLCAADEDSSTGTIRSITGLSCGNAFRRDGFRPPKVCGSEE